MRLTLGPVQARACEMPASLAANAKIDPDKAEGLARTPASCASSPAVSGRPSISASTTAERAGLASSFATDA